MLKNSLRRLVFGLSVALSIPALAQTQSPIEKITDTPLFSPKGLVVIAPAKKYLMRERLFEQLAHHLRDSGYVTVRFNWAPQTLATPGQELDRAAIDLQTVVREAQQQHSIDPRRTVIVSKSFSTKALGLSTDLASTHVLLTPNCSVEEPFQATYGKLLENPDISLSIFISNEDPYCNVQQIHETLKALPKLPTLFTTHGDHNFALPANPPAQQNFMYQNQVIDLVTAEISRILNPPSTPTSIPLDQSLSKCRNITQDENKGVFSGDTAKAMSAFLKAHQLHSPATFVTKIVNHADPTDCQSDYHQTLETWNCSESKGACAVQCNIEHVRNNSFCWP